MADKQISQLVAATTINDEDLFVMQQGGTAKKLSGQKLSDFVYQSAADQIERVDEAVEQAQAAVESLEEQKNEIAQTIADMAELGTDTTLSTPGMAADAAATGVVKDIANANFVQKTISGVPIASFDDGADNVPVKELTIKIDAIQKGSGDPSLTNIRDIVGWSGTNIYRASKNLCGGRALRDRVLISLSSATDYPENGYVTIPADSPVKCPIVSDIFKPNTRYTFILSLYKASAGASNLRVWYTDGTTDDIPSISEDATIETIVFTSAANKTVRRLSKRNSSWTTRLYYDHPCGIFEGVHTIDDYIPFSDSDLYTIEFPQEAGIVYSGTLDVANGILKVDGVLHTITEITGMSGINGYARVVLGDLNTYVTAQGICNMLVGPVSVSSTSDQFKFNINNSTAYNKSQFIFRFDSSYEGETTSATKANYDAKLAELNANETPLQVLTYLQQPVTYQLTPIEVKTLLALNNIWQDAGNIIKLIYRKMPVSDNEIYSVLESMIAGVEDTMEATDNYSNNDLVVAAHQFIRIIDNIAAGESFDIGYNCVITTVSAELLRIRNAINSLGNMANLTYEVVT